MYSNVLGLHNLAMRHYLSYLRSGVRKDLLVAYSLESEAAERFRMRVEWEPARGVLFYAASLLASYLGHYGEAKRLATTGLLGSPEGYIKESLRRVRAEAVDRL